MPVSDMGNMQSPVPDTGMGSPMASPQQQQQLLDMIDATRGKLGELNAAHFAQQNSSEAERLGALKEVFSMLEQAGVNLNDPQSVGAFLDKIKQLNPQMFQLFESSLQSLLGMPQQQGVSDMNTQNPNEMIPSLGTPDQSQLG